jgi:hypothetical protein
VRDRRRAASIRLPETETRLRRGSDRLDLFAGTIPPPFLRTILGWVRTHGRKEGERVAEITPLRSLSYRLPRSNAELSVP